MRVQPAPITSKHCVGVINASLHQIDGELCSPPEGCAAIDGVEQADAGSWAAAARPNLDGQRHYYGVLQPSSYVVANSLGSSQ
jgi:hypothetical protein